MEKKMLPIIDYGGIALVIPKIAAVGNVIENDNNFIFEVFMDGMMDPFAIAFPKKEEAEETREELIAMIAQYHYVTEFGSDLDFDEYDDDVLDDDKDKH